MPSITMPRLSDSMVDGTIVSWLRADGEEIAVGDEIVEIETDKAIMPYQAEHAGPLHIVARDGEVIAVGALIGHIGQPDSVDQAAVAPAVATASSATRAAAVAATPAAPPASNANGRVKASPVAKRLAASLGIDLATLTGSGPGGRIVKRDVQSSESPRPAAGERQPLTTTQATIARRMVEAKSTAPDFTVTMQIDMQAAVDLRAQLKATAVEPLPSLGDFVIRACALVLRENPRINASYVGDAIELHAQVNIGVAVAAEGSLLVPTLHDADTKSLGQIATETRALAQTARDGRLTPAQMANATFTVSNLGMFGVSQFTAVLNPPQAAILAVGAAEQQVVVRDGQFVARHRMNATLTADHRLVYGADAAMFLASVRDALENPLKLLI
jgi:pyruvate dehydrogenase E2 component (dihydrolipoamide acetyltransferase)